MVTPLNDTILDKIYKECNEYNLLILVIRKDNDPIYFVSGNCKTILSETTSLYSANFDRINLYWYRVREIGFGVSEKNDILLEPPQYVDNQKNQGISISLTGYPQLALPLRIIDTANL